MDMMAKFFQKQHSGEGLADLDAHLAESDEQAVMVNASHDVDSLDELKRQWMSQAPNWDRHQSESESSVDDYSDRDDFESDDALFDEESSSENFEAQVTDFIARMKSDNPDLRPDISECITWADDMLIKIDKDKSSEHSVNNTMKSNPSGHLF